MTRTWMSVSSVQCPATFLRKSLDFMEPSAILADGAQGGRKQGWSPRRRATQQAVTFLHRRCWGVIASERASSTLHVSHRSCG